MTKWSMYDAHDYENGTCNGKGFLGGSDGKESACKAGDLGSVSGLGGCPEEGHGNPLQYSCLENPHGQRSLAGCSPGGHKESDMTEQVSTAYTLKNQKAWCETEEAERTGGVWRQTPSPSVQRGLTDSSLLVDSRGITRQVQRICPSPSGEWAALRGHTFCSGSTSWNRIGNLPNSGIQLCSICLISLSQ